MGEKVYKPILNDGSHLLRSTDNPDRVRGLSRDNNNQNPDIPEWEEYDLDDLMNPESTISPTLEDRVQLTPEQEQLAIIIGTFLANLAVKAGENLFQKVVKPWWDHTCYPWLLHKKTEAVDWIHQKIGTGKSVAETNHSSSKPLNTALEDVSAQLDAALDQLLFDLSEEEYKDHVMKLVYHMLGMANEIRIISHARIRKNCVSEEFYIQCQQETEKFLAEKVAKKLNLLLSDKNLMLDLNTSRELFSLTGGGVWLNNEYVPVQPEKINAAIKYLPLSN